jgi:hypothetical protein
LLPYEVPIIFSNDRLYGYLKKLSGGGMSIPPLIRAILDQNLKFSIPFNYEIRKTADAQRTLSVIHPASQSKFVKFYKDNYGFITYHCSRSEFSLRYPTKVASQYYEKALAGPVDVTSHGGGVETEADAFGEQPRFSSSYFLYRKYDFLYKFYDSYEFHRLEKKFRFLHRFDISKCFHSIYTHSIAWAVKDKEFTKENLDATSFEKSFDELMQHVNYKETNGIVIGPEVSRIFAEIILQRVDTDAMAELDRIGLKYRVDYSVRRYIDDYFVFAHSEDVYRLVATTFERELKKYRLYINESKTSTLEIPFATKRTMAKIQLQACLKAYFAKAVDFKVLSELKKVSPAAPAAAFACRHPYGLSVKLIRDIKCVVKESGGGYYGVSGYGLAVIRKHLTKVFHKINLSGAKEEECMEVQNYLLFLLDTAFFLYAMDMRVRNTYLISNIVLIANEVGQQIGNEIDHVVHKKIVDECSAAMENFRAANGGAGVELGNLLIVYRSLARGYDLTEAKLCQLFAIKTSAGPGGDLFDLKKLNYFDLVLALYYMRDSEKYERIRGGLLKEVEEKFTRASAPHQHAELMLLFFDCLACPYIDIDFKKIIVSIVSFKLQGKPLHPDAEVNRVINYCKRELFFVDWSGELDIKAALMKKELKSPYGE